MSNWKYPHTRDLRELVRFADDGGAIWLGENRMLLFHAASMGTLRRELIRKQGVEEARRMLTGIGYEAGLLDAEIARHLRPTDNLFEAFFTGPQLHMLEGSVRVSAGAAGAVADSSTPAACSISAGWRSAFRRAAICSRTPASHWPIAKSALCSSPFFRSTKRLPASKALR